MTKLFRANVSDTQFRHDGIGYYVQHGDPLTVDGTPMVKVGMGSIVLAAGWKPTYSDALLDAADRIDELGHRLLLQAERLRAEAALKAEVPA